MLLDGSIRDGETVHVSAGQDGLLINDRLAPRPPNASPCPALPPGEGRGEGSKTESSKTHSWGESPSFLHGTSKSQIWRAFCGFRYEARC